MWDKSLQTIVANIYTYKDYKYNIILFIHITIVALNKIIAKKIRYMKPSTLIIVAIKIFIYGIKLIRKNKSL